VGLKILSIAGGDLNLDRRRSSNHGCCHASHSNYHQPRNSSSTPFPA